MFNIFFDLKRKKKQVRTFVTRGSESEKQKQQEKRFIKQCILINKQLQKSSQKSLQKKLLHNTRT